MAKILLAEDDIFLLDIYTEVLRDEGFDLTTAIDGSEALEKLKDGGWDLVLLDVVMPKMSGVEVLKQIKGVKPQTFSRHIVFMTNSDDEKGIEEVIDMTDGYIMKSSFTPGEILDKVKYYLSK